MSMDAKKMKVGELKEALAARGLDTSGLKAELVHRLEMVTSFGLILSFLHDTTISAP